MVKVSTNEQALEYEPDSPSLLIFLESHNIQPQYQCREGFCGACRCKLKSGEVSYNQEPLAFIRTGDVLLCCAKPVTDIELDI